MQFFQIVMKKICCRKKTAAVKSEKLKVFISKFYDIILFSSTCSVQLTCQNFIIFILGFQSWIPHKIENTINCRLKLNKYNNRSFFGYLPSSITIFFIKANKNKSFNLKLLKYKPSKILNIVKCSRNFEIEKRPDQNFITQISVTERYIAFRRKKTVKTMSKGGYIWINFGFFWVAVHFLSDGVVVVDIFWWWWVMVA